MQINYCPKVILNELNRVCTVSIFSQVTSQPSFSFKELASESGSKSGEKRVAKTLTDFVVMQGSRVRPIWSHMRPKYLIVRLKKILGRTAAPDAARVNFFFFAEAQHLSMDA